MKVNKPTGTSFVQSYQKQQTQLQTSKKGVTGKKDQVQISDAAKAMLHSNGTDPARQEIVKEIKEQVQTGNYAIDSQETAEKLYDFWFKS